MKRFTILLAALLFCDIASYAQKGFHAGIEGAAFNTAIIDKNKYGDVAYDYKMTIKPMYAIEAGYMWNDMVGFQVEAAYTRLGQQYRNITQPWSDAMIHKEYNLDYFSVPVMLMYTGGAYRTRFTGMTGVSFNFLSSATESAGYQSPDNSNPSLALPNNADVAYRFNPFDMGLLVAAGGNVNVYKMTYISLELRLYYGFKTINKDKEEVMMSNAKTQENEQLQNAYIGLCLGLHNIFRKETE